MKHITLGELLNVTASPRLTVTVTATLNAALPVTLDVDSANRRHWEALLGAFGHYEVISVAPLDDDTLSISAAPPTGTARETKGGMTE